MDRKTVRLGWFAWLALASAFVSTTPARAAASYFANVRMPGVVPVVTAAAVPIVAAVAASPMPAARASRVDVLSALKAE